MRKSIVKTSLVFILALSCCLAVFLSGVAGGSYAEQSSLAYASDYSSAGSGNTTYIRFYPVNTASNGNVLLPDSTTGKIQISVGISNVADTPDDEVTLTITTRNKSAVAGIDYEANTQEFTLTKAGGSQYFTVQTNVDTYAPNLVESGKSSDDGTTRTFEIVLCSIVSKLGNKCVVTNEFNSTEEGVDSFECRVKTRYDYEYTIKDGATGIYFTDYLYGKSFASAWFEGKTGVSPKIYYQTPSGTKEVWVDNDESYHFEKSFGRLIDYDYIVKYQQNGWADIYYGGSAVISESGWCTVDTPATVTLKDESGTQIYFSQYYDPKSSGAPIVFGETKYAHNNNSDYSYDVTSATKEWLEKNQGYTVFNSNDPMNSRVSGYAFQSLSGKVYKSNADTLTLRVERDSTWKMVFSALRIDSELYDTTAPTVQGTYLDNISSTDNKTLRLSVRFSEPVHFATNIDKTGVSISGFADGNTQKPLVFDYSGGEGTDTLYFDCNLKDYTGLSYEKFSTIKFNEATFDSLKKAVYDYAYNFEMSNNAANFGNFAGATFDVNIDKRVPNIDKISCPTYASPSQKHEVGISVSNMAESANSGSKLYYTWVEASKAGSTDEEVDNYSPATYDSCNTTTPTELTVTGSGLDGEYYLFCKAQSAYGEVKTGHSKKLTFDNTPVAILSMDLGNANAAMVERTLDITFDGKKAELQSVTMSFRQSASESWTVSDVLASMKFASDDATEATLKIDKDVLGMGDDQNKRFYFKFKTTDTAGNTAEFETSESYLFDTSDRCAVRLDITGTACDAYDEIKVENSTTIGESGKVYKNTYSYVDFALKFTPIDAASTLSIASLKVGSKVIAAENYGDYFTIAGNGTSNLLMTYNKTEGGYYTIQLENGSGDKKSEVFSFYVMGEKDAVKGYQTLSDNKVVSNKVYMLDGVDYYYWSSARDIKSIAYYNENKSLSLVFSSSDKAWEYVRFMELQDLSVVLVTDAIATSINSGSSDDYRKAPNEPNATSGQIWIRYKSATWNQSSEAKDWNMYYYSDSSTDTTIDIDKLSSSLRSAIKSVVDKIVNKGKSVDVTGDDWLDSNNVPVIDASRIRKDKLTSIQTRTGWYFSKTLEFEGDAAIYDGVFFDVDGKTYPFAVQQLTASDYTTIFIKARDEIGYTKYVVSGKFYLKKLINGTGVFDIFERDENGARQYSVYIDNSSPRFSFTIENAKGKVDMELGGGDEISSLNVKSFTLGSVVDADKCAYVAVYYSANGALKNMYRSSEISQVKLDDGRYQIVVLDRSGNGYSFLLRVSSESVAQKCAYEKKDNEYLTFTCDYSFDEIARFEIKLDGVLIVDSTNSIKSGNKITFYEGGEYEFYVEDLYGNFYNQKVKFEREAPQVIWYFDNGTEFVRVDETDTTQLGFVQTRIGSSEILVTSKGKVRFRIPSGTAYRYQLLNGTTGIEYNAGTAYTEVAIDQTDNWQIKVYFSNYENLYTIYTGKSDSSAPTISATTSKKSYSYADENAAVIDAYLKKLSKGDIINFEDVSFIQNPIATQSVISGELVTGGTVDVRISDASGLYKWSYTFKGKTTEYTENIPEKISFNTEGTYYISATDKLGNTSTFSFTIGRAEYTEISVDDFEATESNKVYYGNDNIVATLEGAGSFVAIIDGEYFKLTWDGKTLTRTILYVDEATASDGSTRRIVRAEETKYDNLSVTPTEIGNKDDESKSVRVYLKDGAVCLEIALKKSEDGTADTVHKTSVRLRVQSDIVLDTKYVEATLSDEKVYLDYCVGDVKGSLNQTSYFNEQFSVSVPSSDIVNATGIYLVLYSKDGTFADATRQYIIGDAYEATEQGYYRFEIASIYGNVSTVDVAFSVGILSTATVVYDDDTSVTYAPGYEGVFYSNKAFSLSISEDVGYSVTKDGNAYSPQKTISSSGIMTLTVEGNGEYRFSLSDTKFGNTAERTVVINKKTLEYSSSWLTGFNEKALKDGYTNTYVYFNVDALGEVTTVSATYASASETFDVADDKQALKDYTIGKAGEGAYVVTFRDKYGNKAVKNINFRSTPAISAKRITRTMDETVYEIDADVLANGIWSNKNITLDTVASTYIFKVNGVERDLPYVMEFPNASGNGRYEYTVGYVDEYGFEYEFKCVLYRTSIEVKEDTMDVKDGVTKNSVAITFGEEYFAQISINGTDRGEYKSGTRYSVDGNYVISVYDVAGNVTRYTVKRDSIVDYCFYTDTIDEKLASGEVTNNSVVRFAPLNGDSVSYSLIYHDGKEVSGYELTSFNESGKWEVVLADEVGNKDYFCFHIISHAYVSYEYNTPNGYKITQITCDNGGGKINWADAVDDNGDSSHIALTENGKYDIEMASSITGKICAFTITIDKSVPQITLDGVGEGSVAKQDVKISGYKAGDTVYIYRNGKLEKEIKVTASSDVPEITEKGKYKVVVVNEAGGTSEVEFERVYTANVATTALIIGVILVVVVGLFAGLFFRKRSRVE